jgi:hypothetical protein
VVHGCILIKRVGLILLNTEVGLCFLHVSSRSLGNFLNKEQELKRREATMQLDQVCRENQTNSAVEFLCSPESFKHFSYLTLFVCFYGHWGRRDDCLDLLRENGRSRPPESGGGGGDTFSPGPLCQGCGETMGHKAMLKLGYTPKVSLITDTVGILHR